MAKKLDMPKEEVQKLVDYGFTQDQMAEYFECSTPTIKNRMKEYGVEPSGGTTNLGKLIMELEEKVEKIEDNLTKPRIETIQTNENKEIKKEEESIKVKISSKLQNYTLEENNLFVYNRLNDIYIQASETVEIYTKIFIEIPSDVSLFSSVIFSDSRDIYGTCILSEYNEIIVIINNYNRVDHYELSKNSVKAIAKVSFVKNLNVNWIE
jgi:hypothetical protein